MKIETFEDEGVSIHEAASIVARLAQTYALLPDQPAVRHACAEVITEILAEVGRTLTPDAAWLREP